MPLKMHALPEAVYFVEWVMEANGVLIKHQTHTISIYIKNYI